MDLLVDRLDHSYEEGRSDVAPELAYMDVQPMMLFILQRHAIKNYFV